MPLFEAYADEESAHQPTNVPADLEERAHRVFEYTHHRSGSGHIAYVKPQTEDGYPDYGLMLDLMGMEAGRVFRWAGMTGVVLRRIDVSTRWGDRYHVERGGMRVATWNSDNAYHQPGERRTYRPGDDGPSVKRLWEAFIHGHVEVGPSIEEGWG